MVYPFVLLENESIVSAIHFNRNYGMILLSQDKVVCPVF